MAAIGPVGSVTRPSLTGPEADAQSFFHAAYFDISACTAPIDCLIARNMLNQGAGSLVGRRERSSTAAPTRHIVT